MGPYNGFPSRLCQLERLNPLIFSVEEDTYMELNILRGIMEYYSTTRRRRRFE
jgi:hypothetical protein